MPKREKAKRLNLWDFDDTLADSWDVTKGLYEDYPDIEQREWWHDPDVSTHAALLTPPITSSWQKMANMDGEHWILTGRVLDAVLAWLEENITDPTVDAGVKSGLIDVISTSGRKWKGEAEGTAARKAEFVAGLCDQYEEIHLFDDYPPNLEAIGEACPKVVLHLVKDGKIVNPADLEGEWDELSPT